MEKGNSFLNRFLPQPVVNLKNESQIEEELDKFQLSNNSSLKNLLFSSTDSGIDKNAYDLSVDSNAIENY